MLLFLLASVVAATFPHFVPLVWPDFDGMCPFEREYHAFKNWTRGREMNGDMMMNNIRWEVRLHEYRTRPMVGWC